MTSTDRTYTGHDITGTGLMDYNARFYSPTLGRFTQPDTIIPDAANPQSWNRYSYGLNNPSRYTDPSGHRPVEGCGDEGKNACHASDLEKALNAQKLAELQYDPTGKKQKTNQKIAKTILEDGTELVASILFEPADWAYTANHCFSGDCSPWMLLGSLPLIPSIAGKHADDVIGAVHDYGKYADSSVGVTVIGYKEDLDHFLRVSGLNRLYGAPDWSWKGLNVPFLDEAMERGDTIVLISDLAAFENRITHSEVQYILEKGYDKILDMYGNIP